MPDAKPPVRSSPLDRSAVERVLARAAELQATGSDSADGSELTEAQLVEIAREAGLSPANVRQAIAEERTRIALPEERGLAAALAGPATTTAMRIVPGTPAQVSARVDQWLDREACMRVLRRYGERVVWEPRRDFLGNLRRGLSGGDGGALRGVTSLAVSVTDAGDGRSLVRLDADVRRARSQRLAVGGVTASTGAAAGATMLGVGVVAHAMLAVVVPLAIVPIVAGAGAAYAIARAQRGAVERVQTSMERLLDRLEHGDLTPPRGTPLLDALHEVRRALR
jgi:hypothetical protein